MVMNAIGTVMARVMVTVMVMVIVGVRGVSFPKLRRDWVFLPPGRHLV